MRGCPHAVKLEREGRRYKVSLNSPVFLQNPGGGTRYIKKVGMLVENFEIDLFSLYVLLPHFRPRDGTLENHCFQILKYLRAYE